MLVTSIFSFSHNVFNSIRDKKYHAFNLDQSRILSFGKELNPAKNGDSEYNKVSFKRFLLSLGYHDPQSWSDFYHFINSYTPVEVKSYEYHLSSFLS